MMKPRYTLTLTDTTLGEEMTIAVDDLKTFKEKAISGKSQVYDFLEIAEQELGKASSHPTE